MRSEQPSCRLGLAMEYHIGHKTHTENFLQYLKERSDVSSRPILLPYDGTPGWWSRLPGVRSNWSLRASLGAAIGLQRAKVDVALFHTQVTSLFSAGWMQSVPSVISLDATPLQYDHLGTYYGHAVSSNSRLESLKKKLNQKAFAAARQLVTWSEWAKNSLVKDYNVAADKVTVIPPGIHTDLWDFPVTNKTRSSDLNILFVGGDFERKGGSTLLEAFRRIAPRLPHATLHLVTPDKNVLEEKQVKVHRHLTPNSTELRTLFAEADIFAFPTQADCLPLAVLEAHAAGLPVVTTAIAALPEVVRHGENGLVVPPQDSQALGDALNTLAGDKALRLRMSQLAREQARARFEARQVYGDLLELVRAGGA